MIIREFNNSGMNEFRNKILELKSNPSSEINLTSLYENKIFCRQFEFDKIEFELIEFENRYEFGKYLFEIFENIHDNKLINNLNLWNWISAVYFDQICNKIGDNYKVNELARYELSLDGLSKFKHLVYYSWYYYKIHKEDSIIFLSSSLSVISQLYIFTGKQYIHQNNEIIKVLRRLYWDETHNKLKPGHSNENKPGNVKRIPAIFNQLELNWDLLLIDEQKLLELLPEEFQHWLEK